MPSVMLGAVVQSPVPGGLRAGGQRKGMLRASERHQGSPRERTQITAHTKQALLSVPAKAAFSFWSPVLLTKYGTSAWWGREAEPCQCSHQPVPTCSFPLLSVFAGGWMLLLTCFLYAPCMFASRSTVVLKTFKNIPESAHDAYFLLCDVLLPRTEVGSGL